jgi:uncharacterized membrane protein YfcA
MTGLVIICVAAFVVAILTFFSGFGLGTILTPVFMIFFPVDLSIALTGVVHFCNNIFKVILVGKNANRDVLIAFGIPAVIAAFIGAWLLLRISDLPPLFSYIFQGRLIEVSPVKFAVALLLLIFALIELIPWFSKVQFDKNKLPIGGALSGFFGGLSGNQGALRSAFLIRAGLTKESYIGTAVVVSSFVDLTRLSVYATRFTKTGLHENILLVSCATVSAILGAFIGNRLLKKVTLVFIQRVVAILLICISIGLGCGII